MKVFCTSMNSGPLTIVYLGTSIEEATKAVGVFAKYKINETEFPTKCVQNYSAIPKLKVDWKLLQYYMADGWWYSIVSFDLYEDQ